MDAIRKKRRILIKTFVDLLAPFLSFRRPRRRVIEKPLIFKRGLRSNEIRVPWVPARTKTVEER